MRDTTSTHDNKGRRDFLGLGALAFTSLLLPGCLNNSEYIQRLPLVKADELLKDPKKYLGQEIRMEGPLRFLEKETKVLPPIDPLAALQAEFLPDLYEANPMNRFNLIKAQRVSETFQYALDCKGGYFRVFSDKDFGDVENARFAVCVKKYSNADSCYLQLQRLEHIAKPNKK